MDDSFWILHSIMQLTISFIFSFGISVRIVTINWRNSTEGVWNTISWFFNYLYFFQTRYKMQLWLSEVKASISLLSKYRQKLWCYLFGLLIHTVFNNFRWCLMLRKLWQKILLSNTKIRAFILLSFNGFSNTSNQKRSKIDCYFLLSN